MTMSAPAAASAGDAAARAPSCASAHAWALPGVRVQAVTAKPLPCRFAAIREPMMPSPRKPTLVMAANLAAASSPPRAPSGGRERGAVAGAVDAQTVGHGGRLGAAAHVELGQDPGDVHGGRLLGHVQLVADLAVGVALGHEDQDVALAA